MQFPLSLSLLGLFLLGSTRTKTEQLSLHGYLQNSTQKSDNLKATKIKPMNKLGDLCSRFLDIVKDISQLSCTNLELRSSTHSGISLAAVIMRLSQQH